MIERTLLGTNGIGKAVVALSTSRGCVEFDPTILGPRDVIQIVKVTRVACKQYRLMQLTTCSSMMYAIHFQVQ